MSNAASMIGTNTVAAGSMISIALIPQLDEPFVPIDPTSLNVTIRPNGSNLAEECEIVPASVNFGQFVNPFQVVAVLPSTLALGPAQLSLYHSGLTAVAQISIVPSSLGLFPPSVAHTVQQMGSDQVLRANQLTHPAQPGDTLMLWGTGLGSANQATVLLGGRAVNSSSAGPAPGQPGIDQIQFVVPDDPTIPNDCYVAAQVQTAGATTNTISIAKTSDGSACQSSLGLTATDLATLDAGGTVGLGQLTVAAQVGRPLLRLGDFLLGILTAPATANSTALARTESANFFLSGQNAADVAQISGFVVSDDALFGCTASPAILSTITSVAYLPSTLSLWSTFTLQGSGGELDLKSPFLPSALFSGTDTSPTAADPNQLPPPLFTPGAWTFSGSGGSSLVSSAPFSVPLTLPPEVMATNFSELQTIDRQQDLVIMWNPIGFGEKDVLTAALNGNAVPEWFSGGRTTVACRVPAASGQLVVPAAMLQYLAPSKSGSLLGLAVTRKPGTLQTFSIPLSSTKSLPAVLRFTSSENWPVTVE